MATEEPTFVLGRGCVKPRNLSPVGAAIGSTGVPACYVFELPDGPGAIQYEIVMGYRFKVYDVVVVKRDNAGGAGDEVEVWNELTTVTGALSLNVADEAIVRPALLSASNVLLLGDTMRIITTAGGIGNVACSVVVLGFNVVG